MYLRAGVPGKSGPAPQPRTLPSAFAASTMPASTTPDSKATISSLAVNVSPPHLGWLIRSANLAFPLWRFSRGCEMPLLYYRGMMIPVLVSAVGFVAAAGAWLLTKEALMKLDQPEMADLHDPP